MSIPLIHSQNVDFVLCGAVARRTAVDVPGLLIVIPWLGNGCISINFDSTTICVC